MAKKVLDEDLLEGLQQAKLKPRNYVIVVKDKAVVGMTVNKRKIRPADVQKLRAQKKGNGEFTGVCLRNAADLTLQVLGAEPTLALPKLREFIEAQTELKLKPQWGIVTALTVVPDEVDDDKNQQWMLAAAPAPEPEPLPVRLQNCRAAWEAARQKLQGDLQVVAREVRAHCANPAEYDPAAVQAGCKRLDGLLDKLDLRLIAKLDEALSAAQPEDAQARQQEAAKIVQEYVALVAQNELIARIDETGIVPAGIRTTMGEVLQQMASQL